MMERTATTHWSLVLQARDGAGTEARQALESLCQIYWNPLYCFVRHLGWDPEEARDLTQAYFVKLLEENLLSEVDAARGRFRSFLFSTMRHFLSHERERSRALKRGGRVSILSLDIGQAEASYATSSTARMTPEQVFEHRWAMTVIASAMNRLQSEAARAGTERQFKRLSRYLTSLERHVPYRETARDLRMSEGAVKVAVHRLRKRFGRCLRAELARIVPDLAAVDDELLHMLSVLRQ